MSRGVWAGLATAIALGGGTIAAIVIGQGGGGAAPAGLANIWVENGAGTCTGGRSATPISFTSSASPDRICGSFDLAWDAMNAGDTARIRNGTYEQQFITGNKTAITRLIGESKSGVRIEDTITEECYPAFGAGTLLCPDANFVWIENITVDTNEEDGPAPGSLIAGQNVTYTNVDILGWWPDVSVGSTVTECTSCDGTGFTWNGGTWGDLDPPPRPCGAAPGGNGEPVWVYFPDVTINGITFNPQTVELEISSGGTCAENDNAHLEYLRLESAADNMTFSNNTFVPGASSGSGYIFYSVSTVDNFKIIGNYFADNEASTWIQVNNAPCGVVVAYNTFDPSGDDSAAFGGCDPTWVGNLGPSAPGCGSGTRIKNVWGGTGSCGTDTYVGAASLAVDPITGNLNTGSPAINAAETPSASDYCTNAAYVNSVDRYGTIRPIDVICDAGSYEYGG